MEQFALKVESYYHIKVTNAHQPLQDGNIYDFYSHVNHEMTASVGLSSSSISVPSKSFG